MAIRIRFATPSDARSIEAIENDTDQLLIDWLAPDQWQAAPSGASRVSQSGYLLVAEETGTGTVVGFVQVLEIEGLAHLEQVSVAPAHARRGYGRQLLAAALDEARARGHDRMSLPTYADVPWNGPFYSLAGFEEVVPGTDFHRSLLAVEQRLGLPGHGRRVQMTAELT